MILISGFPGILERKKTKGKKCTKLLNRFAKFLERKIIAEFAAAFMLS